MKPLPTGTMRPSVMDRCSAIECGSVSQPQARSFGTTNFRQVSASLTNFPASPATKRQLGPDLLQHLVVNAYKRVDPFVSSRNAEPRAPRSHSALRAFCGAYLKGALANFKTGSSGFGQYGVVTFTLASDSVALPISPRLPDF